MLKHIKEGLLDMCFRGKLMLLILGGRNGGLCLRLLLRAGGISVWWGVWSCLRGPSCDGLSKLRIDVIWFMRFIWILFMHLLEWIFSPKNKLDLFSKIIFNYNYSFNNHNTMPPKVDPNEVRISNSFNLFS